jgi:hypothetical protein
MSRRRARRLTRCFGRVQESDYPALLALQEANLRDNLTPDQRSEGFLSARFSRDQFATMNADVGSRGGRDRWVDRRAICADRASISIGVFRCSAQ